MATLKWKERFRYLCVETNFFTIDGVGYVGVNDFNKMYECEYEWGSVSKQTHLPAQK